MSTKKWNFLRLFYYIIVESLFLLFLYEYYAILIHTLLIKYELILSGHFDTNFKIERFFAFVRILFVKNVTLFTCLHFAVPFF